MNHTPGPWRLMPPGARIGKGAIDISTDELEGSFATVHVRLSHPQEGQANANLIAAAPTMLATLEEIAAFAVGNGDVCEIIARRARAVIALAEGRTS